MLIVCGSDPNVLGILLNYGHADEERNVREIFHADDFSFKEARPVLVLWLAIMQHVF